MMMMTTTTMITTTTTTTIIIIIIIKLILLTTFCKVFYVFPFRLTNIHHLLFIPLTLNTANCFGTGVSVQKKVGSKELVVTVHRVKSHRMTQT